MKTPQEVCDLLHNAIHFLPADGRAYQHGRYKSAHKPSTIMACEQVLVLDPGKGAAWRRRKQGKAWARPEYVETSEFTTPASNAEGDTEHPGPVQG